MSEQPNYRPVAEVMAEKKLPRNRQQLESDIRAYRGMVEIQPDNLAAHWVILDCRCKLGQISQEEFDWQFAAIKAQIGNSNDG